MIRLLIIISVAGLLLCAVCLSAAFGIGGREIMTKGWSWNEWQLRIDEENDDVSFTPAAKGQGGVFVNGQRVDDENGEYSAYSWGGADTTREVEWAGAGEINVGMPADVTYTQGAVPKLTVTGPAEAVNNFYAEGGRLRLRGWNASNTFHGAPSAADLSGSNRPPRLKIDIVAPGVTHFDVSGSETLTIEDYNQDSINLDVTGAARVTAKGSARYAKLDVDGAAHADLGGMSLNEAQIDIDGASRAILGPRASIKADVGGAARLTLSQQPAREDVDVDDAGVVEHGPGAPAPPPVPPVPPVPPAPPAAPKAPAKAK